MSNPAAFLRATKINIASFILAFACLSAAAETAKVDYFSIAKRQDAYGMTSPFTADGRFIEEVAPDVLSCIGIHAVEY